MKTIKKAFTLLELIFVIIILGVVASLSTDIITTSYISFIHQRAYYTANINTEIASMQIANRLRFSIPNTLVKRDGSNITNLEDITGSTNSPTSLQWVGYDADSFTAYTSINDARPGWSGFIDLATATRTSAKDINFTSSGSNLSLATTIRQNLGAKSSTSVALFFPTMYSSQTIGYNGGDASGIRILKSHNGSDTMHIQAPPSYTLKEQYKLAWSAYAIVPVNENTIKGTFDLALRYNFQPWMGATHTYDAQEQIDNQKILAKNVSVFRFRGSENSIHFKLCIKEQTGIESSDFITACKERVVLR